MSVKENHFAELWRDTVPTETPCPHPLNPEDMVRRVNAALDGRPSERRPSMGQKFRFSIVLAAVLAVLAGAALAVTVHFDVLDAFFQGDPSAAEALVDREVRSVSDKDYTLTVESSVSDGETAYLVVRVDAQSEEAAAALCSKDFFSADTFLICPVSDDDCGTKNSNVYLSIALQTSIEELGEAATGTSRTWRIQAALEPGDHYLDVRLSCMGPDAVLTVPLSPAESITVEIGASGQGLPSLYFPQGGSVRLDSVTLSPFSCRAEIWRADATYDASPLFFFLQTDGTLLTTGQTIAQGQSCVFYEDGTGSCLYRFQSVMDLSQLSAVVFDGTAYPLDGGQPYAVEIDPKLYPFQIPLMDPITEEGGFALPVEDLCEALGASYEWKEDTQTATCAYRDTTIVLTVGSSTVLVNGEPADLGEPVVLRDGTLAAGWRLAEHWGLDVTAAYNEAQTERTCWVVIP